MSLNLGDHTINYRWTSKDLQNNQCERSTKEVFNFTKTSDHLYASAKLVQYHESDDDVENIDYSTIFDSQGNWQQRHKRSIINVMDSYHISHEAYHELRHAGKGHFPPLYQIRNEKRLMSAEIPYIKHPTVISVFIDNSKFRFSSQFQYVGTPFNTCTACSSHFRIM